MKPPNPFRAGTQCLSIGPGNLTRTAHEFNQNPSEARKAAQHGAVFITDRGQPAHVLLSIDAYRQLTEQQMTLLDAVAQPPNPDEPDFEPGRLGDFLKVPDLL